MPDLKQEDLDQFSGSDVCYRHWAGRLFYTEGVKYLADHGEAHWLIDAIAAAQLDPNVKNNPMLQEIQFWKLQALGSYGKLTCVEDSNRAPIYVQDIPFTDFPLEEVRIWVEYGMASATEKGFVAMLPSER